MDIQIPTRVHPINKDLTPSKSVQPTTSPITPSKSQNENIEDVKLTLNSSVKRETLEDRRETKPVFGYQHSTDNIHPVQPAVSLTTLNDSTEDVKPTLNSRVKREISEDEPRTKPTIGYQHTTKSWKKYVRERKRKLEEEMKAKIRSGETMSGDVWREFDKFQAKRGKRLRISLESNAVKHAEGILIDEVTSIVKKEEKD